MLFNSVEFALFLPLVFILYWLISSRNIKLQNGILLLSSYYFYSCWDWRFLFLLLFSTLLDYFTGIQIFKSQKLKNKRFWFYLSICTNLGLLGLFKYYNFFIESFSEALNNLGFHINPWSLNLILPVGISFYTFHGLSYIIDIYKDRIKPEKNIIDYSVFVSFFPLLVAGPIERATHLLPQIKQQRTFNYANAVNGLRQILWGLVKKVVIADQCAEFANQIFNHSADHSGITLVLGAIFFAFQIYGDFSGYSDIAIGTARLFGIELLKNFSFPYFSRDIAEFWRRWHISLSTWFRDYLYIPLGGNKGNNWKKIRNIFIIFIVSGFWHGANWTFIVWGLLNAVYFLPLLLTNKNRKHLEIVAAGKLLPSVKEFSFMILTFTLVSISWIFFRAKNLDHAFQYIGAIFKNPESFLTLAIYWKYKTIMLVIVVFMLMEWIGREGQYALEKLGLNWKRPFRFLLYYFLIFAIFWFLRKEEEFIYFQF